MFLKEHRLLILVRATSSCAQCCSFLCLRCWCFPSSPKRTTNPSGASKPTFIPSPSPWPGAAAADTVKANSTLLLLPHPVGQGRERAAGKVTGEDEATIKSFRRCLYFFSPSLTKGEKRFQSPLFYLPAGVELRFISKRHNHQNTK